MEDEDEEDRHHHTGYECQKCGYEPTQKELDRGFCPECSQNRAIALNMEEVER